MVDQKRTAQLKEELEHEEALLKNIKDKLVDQLQRLKVCGKFCARFIASHFISYI